MAEVHSSGGTSAVVGVKKTPEMMPRVRSGRGRENGGVKGSTQVGALPGRLGVPAATNGDRPREEEGEGSDDPGSQNRERWRREAEGRTRGLADRWGRVTRERKGAEERHG